MKIDFEKINKECDSSSTVYRYEQKENIEQAKIRRSEAEKTNSGVSEETRRVYAQMAEEIKASFMPIPEGKEWHEISQKEANQINNYNNGLKKALKIIYELLQ